MALEISELTTASTDAWDRYVNAHPHSTFFHFSGWKRVIEKAFGHKTFFLQAVENGELKGILPLARIQSCLFGDNLISLPFCVYGGVVADSEYYAHELVNAATTVAIGMGTETLELRHMHPFSPQWPRKSLYVTFRKQISADHEKNMLAIPKKQRRIVRLAIESGLQSVEDNSVDNLYAAYSESVRNLGTPVFGKQYLQLLREEFTDKCRILTITNSENELVASVMSFYFKNQVLPYYGGGRSLARDSKANDFMYWELMRRSADEGIEWFDFGRSKEGTGSYRFKKHWGFIPEPLHYEVQLITAKAIPEINPLNPKYQRFIRMWQQLPLNVANRVGPFLAKDLG